MKNRWFPKATALAIGVAAGLITGTASADVSKKLDEMFKTQSNATKPGVASGAMRGVVTGGGVRVRNPIVTGPGLHFDPPSISAGCGGIDMYGGNLSFPSKEQFISVGRAVVSNAAGYAFQLALKTLCEPCESVMGNIQDTIQAMNFSDMTSCQIAQQMKDGTFVEGLQNRATNLGEAWRQVTGTADDKNDARRQNQSEGLGQVAEDPQMAEVLNRNWVWDSITKSGMFDWLGGSKRSREEIMSLLGTVIVCIPGQNGCEGEGNDPQVVVKPAIVRLHDFVAPEDEQSDVRLYTCVDEDCLRVDDGGSYSLGANVVQSIEKLLLGTDDSPGVLERMTMSAEDAGTISDSELLLIGSLNQLVANASACYSAGEVGVGDAKILVQGMAPAIAAEAMWKTLDQSLHGMIADIGRKNVAVGAEKAVEMLQQQRADLRQQFHDIERVNINDDQFARAITRCAANPVALYAYSASN